MLFPGAFIPGVIIDIIKDVCFMHTCNIPTLINKGILIGDNYWRLDEK
jgi:hypothetical protein